MNDNPIKAWIDERRADMSEATEALTPEGYEPDFIGLPAALDALSAVLELHKPFEWSFGYEPIKSCRACVGFGAAQDNAEWPCATVQAIEGAINHE